MLKGLDLLLDAFSIRTDYNLIICSNVLKEKEFVTFFHNYLFERKNIRTIGFVDINSELFASITKECAFAFIQLVRKEVLARLFNVCELV